MSKRWGGRVSDKHLTTECFFSSTVKKLSSKDLGK